MSATTLVRPLFPDSILQGSDNTLTSEDEEVHVKSQPIQEYVVAGPGRFSIGGAYVTGVYPAVFPWAINLCSENVILLRPFTLTESLENGTISGRILCAQPLLDENETLDWDVALDSIPVRPSNRIEVSLKFVGRSKPIPIEDPFS